MEWKVDVHNWGDKAKKASVNGQLRLPEGQPRLGQRGRRGDENALPDHAVAPTRTCGRRNDPFLYPVHIGGTPGGYTLHIGVRSLSVSPDGHLLLNGQPTNFRGVGLHEDSLDKGSAIDNATRDRYIAEIKDLGATMIRTHYPLSPYLLEQADKNGILVWSEIPVYSLRSSYLAKRIVRHLAFQELDRQHQRQPEPRVDRDLVGGQRAGVQAAGPGALLPARRRGDRAPRWTRPGPSAWPSSATRPPAASAPTTASQVIGVNEYFGWYPGPQGQVADAGPALRLPRLGPRLLPEQGHRRDRVRRRGQPRRPAPTRRARTRSSRTSSSTT